MYNDILNFIQEGSVLSAFFGFVLMVVLAFIPAIPIPVLTTAIGTAFDFWTTLFICLGGSTIGACIMFLFSRYLFQEKALSYIKRHKQVDVLFELIEKNAFLTVLIGRIIPIFPSVLINLICAVTKISGKTFFIATLLGKLPTMVTFAFAGNQLEKNTVTTAVLVGLYGLIIFLIGLKFKRRLKSP